MAMLTFALTIGYFLLLALTSAETYYITPASNITCPNENMTCLTLSEYAQQSLNASSNITLTLAPGNHDLAFDLRIENVNSLTLQVADQEVNNVSFPIAVVKCNSLRFVFENITKVFISAIEFNGCGENAVRSVDRFRLKGCRFYTGYGIELDRIKDATIELSSFALLKGIQREFQAEGVTVQSSVTAVGGAFFVTYSNVVISECQFTRNMASYGGSIYSEYSHLDIYKSKFRSNRADEEGGAIDAHHGTVTIHNSSFLDLKSKRGGSIKTDYVTITIHKSEFIKNRANVTGGVIDATGDTITMHNSTFLHNSLSSVIYTNKVNMISIHDSEFKNNVLSKGDVINATSGNITIVNSEFYNNWVKGNHGDVIDAVGGNITIENCLFSSNRAEKPYCDIIDVGGGSITIKNSVFNNSRADGRYSNVINATGGTITIESSDFNNNRAAGWDCDIVDVAGGTITLNNSVFFNNKATYLSGDIIDATDGSIAIENCAFNNNRFRGGDLINAVRSTFSIESSEFSKNRPGFNAINVFGGNATIDTCKFRNNRVRSITGNVINAGIGIISIKNSVFDKNGGEGQYGCIIKAVSGTITIAYCEFNENRAQGQNSDIINVARCKMTTIDNSKFTKNIASFNDVIGAYGGIVTIDNSEFHKNKARGEKSDVISIGGGTITIGHSDFTNNEVNSGVIAGEHGGNITVYKSQFMSNSADWFNGHHGVVKGNDTTIYINDSTFVDNKYGGVIDAELGTITVQNSKIFSNIALYGGVIRIVSATITIHNSTFIRNRAEKVTSIRTEVIALIINRREALRLGSGGVIWAERSIVSIHISKFINNTADFGGALALQSSRGNLKDCIFNNNAADRQGGAIWLNSTALTCNGFIQIINNRAAKGIVFSLNSTLLFSGNTSFSNNYYGSLFPLISSQSNITFDGYTTILKNSLDETIVQKTRALSSTVLQPSDIVFRGIVDFPYNQLYNRPHASNYTSVNRIYVYTFADSTIYMQSSVNSPLFSGGECAYQSVLKFNINIKNKNNSATISDKVTDKGEGVYSLVTTSELRFSKIKPVRLCFCSNGQPDCNSSPPTIQVKRGQSFNVSLVAIDQDGNLIPHSLSAFLLSSKGKLGGQIIQSTGYTCREFNYTVFSPHKSEELVLNAYSPCNNIGISQTRINLEFLPCNCPIGFNLNTQDLSNCICDCDPDIFPNDISSCSFATESVQRKGNNWITYFNTSDLEGYLIHPHCPFDYCHPPAEQVWINLNIPNGADGQCAFNRSGKLCGSCSNGVSLSLGSSHCMPCSNNWLALLIVFAMAGVALVAFILVCNLTVAVGTINGLIFFANIVSVNHATFFPFKTPNFFTVFIAWLNLDFGFVTCFFNGMDGYAKTWLQLAFPLYIILMVVAVIIACEYSTQLAKLFMQKNPVATLATLLLLSYTKSLRVIITALSSATLVYPDGSQEIVWRADGNVHYFEGKHIPLFLIALFIMLIGIAYTLFLFFYQWLLRCSHKRALKWIGSARFYPFIDAYHAPYSKKYRYWTGLLLFARAFLYVGVAVNVSGDPSINLLLISCTLLALCLLKKLLSTRVYKQWPLDTLEDSFIFNLLLFSVGTFYVRETGGNQAALAYASTSIAFITFVIILIYHMYAFTLPKKLKDKLKSIKPKLATGKVTVDDAGEIKSVQENKCTYSVVDPIPPPPKTLVEMQARFKSEQKGTPKNKANCPFNESNKAVESTTVTIDNRQNTYERNNQLEITPVNGQKDKQNSNCAEYAQKPPTLEIFVDPYIVDIDQRGIEREKELNDFVTVAQ